MDICRSGHCLELLASLPLTCVPLFPTAADYRLHDDIINLLAEKKLGFSPGTEDSWQASGQCSTEFAFLPASPSSYTEKQETILPSRIFPFFCRKDLLRPEGPQARSSSIRAEEASVDL